MLIRSDKDMTSMKLLYIADRGFARYGGRYFFSRPNYVNTNLYKKYFDEIVYIARNDNYNSTFYPMEESAKVALLRKNDFKGLRHTLKEWEDQYDAALLISDVYGFFAIRQLNKLNKKSIAYCGADPLQLYLSKHSFLSVIKGYVLYVIKRKIVSYADYVQYCTEILYKRYPCRCKKLICSNVEIKVYDNVLEKRLKKILDGDKCKVIGLMGRVVKNKGIDIAIRALSRLGKEYSLEIVGEMDTQNWNDYVIKYGVQNRVTFLGYISDGDKINEWLDNIDVYIQPSRSEGLPRSVIEAMARACPVAASNVGGIPDLIDNKYLSNPEDDQSLADNILKLMGNKEHALNQAEVNFERSKEYSIEVRNQKLENFYKNIKK